MKNTEKFTLFISIIGVIVSISSLGFFSYPEVINNEVFKSLLLGVLGAIVGALTATSVLRSNARAKAPSLFISYHHDNIEIARKIAKEMKKVSGHIWIDEQEINVGDRVKEKVESGLRNSDYFLIVLSEESIKSHWAEAELAKAMEMGKIVFPVKTDDAELPEVIINTAYADLRGSFDIGIDKLKRAFVEAAHNKAMQRTSR